jgi:hypothetical protein
LPVTKIIIREQEQKTREISGFGRFFVVLFPESFASFFLELPIGRIIHPYAK